MDGDTKADNSEEWEDKCAHCGDCCRGPNSTHCPHLMGKSHCSVYLNREFFQYCMSTKEMFRKGYMPAHCGYQNDMRGAQ